MASSVMFSYRAKSVGTWSDWTRDEMLDGDIYQIGGECPWRIKGKYVRQDQVDYYGSLRPPDNCWPGGGFNFLLGCRRLGLGDKIKR